jgi:5-methylthioribose kinase
LVVYHIKAPEFVAIFGPDGFPLTSERMQREMDVYAEWKSILGETLASKYLPQIYYFDKSHMVVIMEFLDGYDLLDHVLVDHAGDYNANVATCLGDFMGKTHAATHSSKVDNKRKEYLQQHFENREMRDIQLEFVFTKCYKEATDEQRAGLTLTPDFMDQVELLKSQYNGKTESLVLTHGDLHPGSVMVDPQGHTKVIDPEFTVYGPPGLDVGSLLSGYCLGAIHQAYSDNPEAVERIVDGAKSIWDAYSKAMTEGGLGHLLKDIEIETVGFTVAEVCRTALEFAGGRKWLQFEDAGTKAAAKKAALQVVDRCMIARHVGGIDLLLKEMKADKLVSGRRSSMLKTEE